MIDLDDPDQALNLLGVLVVVFIVIAVGVLLLSANTTQEASSAAPDADWTLNRVNESHVRITHTGGESTLTERLTVTVDGRPRRSLWSADRLVPGESGLVRAGSGATVTLFWERTGYGRTVLRRWQLPATTESVLREGRPLTGIESRAGRPDGRDRSDGSLGNAFCTAPRKPTR